MQEPTLAAARSTLFVPYSIHSRLATGKIILNVTPGSELPFPPPFPQSQLVNFDMYSYGNNIIFLLRGNIYIMSVVSIRNVTKANQRVKCFFLPRAVL